MPGQVERYGELVWDGYCQEPGWVDLEVSQRGTHHTRDVGLAALNLLAERNVCKVSGLPGERDIQVRIEAWLGGICVRDADRTEMIGNSAPRTTWII